MQACIYDSVPNLPLLMGWLSQKLKSWQQYMCLSLSNKAHSKVFSKHAAARWHWIISCLFFWLEEQGNSHILSLAPTEF